VAEPISLMIFDSIAVEIGAKVAKAEMRWSLRCKRGVGMAKRIAYISVQPLIFAAPDI
jgi:hypothetical protein